MKLSTKIISLVLVVIVFLVIINLSTPSQKYNDFAQCLTNSGVKMYGAYWCPHCLNQKKAFGAAWEKINYIECSLPGGKGRTAICTQAGIEGYPTWEFVDGSRQAGEVSFEFLAEKSGCSLPSANKQEDYKQKG